MDTGFLGSVSPAFDDKCWLSSDLLLTCSPFLIYQRWRSNDGRLFSHPVDIGRNVKHPNQGTPLGCATIQGGQSATERHLDRFNPCHGSMHERAQFKISPRSERPRDNSSKCHVSQTKATNMMISWIRQGDWASTVDGLERSLRSYTESAESRASLSWVSELQVVSQPLSLQSPSPSCISKFWFQPPPGHLRAFSQVPRIDFDHQARCFSSFPFSHSPSAS